MHEIPREEEGIPVCPCADHDDRELRWRALEEPTIEFASGPSHQPQPVLYDEAQPEHGWNYHHVQRAERIVKEMRADTKRPYRWRADGAYQAPLLITGRSFQPTKTVGIVAPRLRVRDDGALPHATGGDEREAPTLNGYVAVIGITEWPIHYHEPRPEAKLTPEDPHA